MRVSLTQASSHHRIARTRLERCRFPWPNGYGVRLRILRLRVRIPPGMQCVYIYIFDTTTKIKKKIIASGGIRTHASEDNWTWVNRLRPLGHVCYPRGQNRVLCLFARNEYKPTDERGSPQRVAHWSYVPKVQDSYPWWCIAILYIYFIYCVPR